MIESRKNCVFMKAVDRFLTSVFGRKFLILPEVINDAFEAPGRRRADAVSIAFEENHPTICWGFEFKENRADWEREIADRKKELTNSTMCNKWSIVTNGNFIDRKELLPGTGLIEFFNYASSVSVVVEAENFSDRKPSWGFVASILKRLLMTKCNVAQLISIFDEKIEQKRLELKAIEADIGEYERRAFLKAESRIEKRREALLEYCRKWGLRLPSPP